MPSNNKQVCPCCGQSINKREISVYSGLLEALWRVFMWCEQKNRHEFDIKEVSHLLDKNSYARFGDLILFGGLVYRPNNLFSKKRKGLYGLNRARILAFFNGAEAIPTTLLKNPLDKTIEKTDYRFISQIKNLGSFLDREKQFIANYR